jgi:hypothetical protein
LVQATEIQITAQKIMMLPDGDDSMAVNGGADIKETTLGGNANDQGDVSNEGYAGQREDRPVKAESEDDEVDSC